MRKFMEIICLSELVQHASGEVKAVSDTLKQIGPSTFADFTRPIIRHLYVSVMFCYIKLY